MGIDLNPKVLALNGLVREELIRQVSNKLGIVMGSDYVATQLSNPLTIHQDLGRLVPYFVLDSSGAINKQLLQAYLQKNRMSVSDFESKVERVFAQRFVLSLLQAASYVPSFAVQERYTSDLPKKFSLLTIPVGRYEQQERAKEISKEDLQKQYEHHDYERHCAKI